MKVIRKKSKELSDDLFDLFTEYIFYEKFKSNKIFHKNLSYVTVYKELINGKTFYLKVSRAKTVKRAILKIIGLKKSRAESYKKKAEKLKLLKFNIVEPEYYIYDTRLILFKKNIMIFRDFGELNDVKEFKFDELLIKLKKDKKILNIWIKKYLDLLIDLMDLYVYHRDCNFDNFFYLNDELYMLDLDDIKINKKFSKEELFRVKKRVKILLKTNFTDKEAELSFNYFKKNIEKRLL